MPIYFNIGSNEMPLTIESIGNNWSQDSVQRPNGFPYYHWLQTTKGEGKIWIDGQSFSIDNNKGILIAPFIPHNYYDNLSKWETSFVTFTGKLSSSINLIVGNEKFILIEEDESFSFKKWIDYIINMEEKKQITNGNISVECYKFLINIYNKQENKNFSDNPLYLRYVLPIIKEIESNYFDNITVELLAKKVYISPQYLTRLFKNFLGCSTYKYLTNYRLIKAKEILVNKPNLPVSKVASLVGYEDTSHFIHVFKKETNATPLEFRKLHF